jgi:hypothetical protein
MPNKPPLYKEFLVGLLVGGLFGPVLGWFIGTFATFFAVTAMDTANVRSMRGSGFIGGLIGIPLGLATGVIVSLPLRLVSTRGLTFLKNPWLAALAGTLIGWVCGYLILTTWYSTFGSLIYVVIVCMVVGGLTGSVAVSAKPKWL